MIFQLRRKTLYTIPYFDELGQHQISPKFPTIQQLANYINETPTRNHSIILYTATNGKGYMVGYTTDCVVLNGKPRRKFINYMTKMIPVLETYVSPWKPVKK